MRVVKWEAARSEFCAVKNILLVKKGTVRVVKREAARSEFCAVQNLFIGRERYCEGSKMGSRQM